jgi:3-methyladenine DNA glycosylase AlkC
MAEPLKNMYDERFFAALTGAVSSVYPAFDHNTFSARIYDDSWPARELKARIRHISVTLRGLLPEDYSAALNIIRQASPALDIYTFATTIFPDFVEVYGLHDWDASIPALEQFTQQSSAEFAVRPFILQDQERMMAQMLAWSQHDSHHVRRLASEGCRPRLPWAVALPAFKVDPSPILPILEQLKHDPSDYVRRSVANNLNDISKDHPLFAIDILRRWQSHDTPEMRQMVNHALRTLVKQATSDALDLLGYAEGGAFAVKNLAVDPATVPMGGEVRFSFMVESLSQTPQNLLIDYILYFMGANGQLRLKVFKLTKTTLAPGESLGFTRTFSFRPITTRRYYPGEHAVAIQINGVVSERCSFTVAT